MHNLPQRAYAFAESPEAQERERLAAIEKDRDTATFRRLDGLGLSLGRAFLEVGPGGGSVVAWACEHVGAEGRVVAVDLDPRFLTGLGCSNLEVRQADIRTAELEPGAYDFVHARNVLLHIQEYELVFDKLVRATKSGGWLLIEDLDLTTQRPATDDPAAAGVIRAAFAAIEEFHVSLGIHLDMGRRLPSLFHRANLERAGVETELPLVPGRSSTAGALALSVRQIAGRMTQAGLSSEDAIRRFLELLDDPGVWMMHASRIAAWGRRP